MMLERSKCFNFVSLWSLGIAMDQPSSESRPCPVHPRSRHQKVARIHCSVLKAVSGSRGLGSGCSSARTPSTNSTVDERDFAKTGPAYYSFYSKKGKDTREDPVRKSRRRANRFRRLFFCSPLRLPNACRSWLQYSMYRYSLEHAEPPPSRCTIHSTWKSNPRRRHRSEASSRYRR